MSALGEIFRAHDSAVTGKRVACKMGRMKGGEPALVKYSLREIADEVPLYEGDHSL